MTKVERPQASQSEAKQPRPAEGEIATGARQGETAPPSLSGAVLPPIQRLYPAQQQAMLKRLNQTHGNQYAQRVAQEVKRSPGARPPALQRKLTLNQPGDVYEQEAETVAAQVMNPATPLVVAPPTPDASSVPTVQRAPLQPAEPEAPAVSPTTSPAPDSPSQSAPDASTPPERSQTETPPPASAEARSPETASETAVSSATPPARTEPASTPTTPPSDVTTQEAVAEPALSEGGATPAPTPLEAAPTAPETLSTEAPARREGMGRLPAHPPVDLESPDAPPVSQQITAQDEQAAQGLAATMEEAAAPEMALTAAQPDGTGPLEPRSATGEGSSLNSPSAVAPIADPAIALAGAKDEAIAEELGTGEEALRQLPGRAGGEPPEAPAPDALGQAPEGDKGGLALPVSAASPVQEAAQPSAPAIAEGAPQAEAATASVEGTETAQGKGGAVSEGDEVLATLQAEEEVPERADATGAASDKGDGEVPQTAAGLIAGTEVEEDTTADGLTAQTAEPQVAAFAHSDEGMAAADLQPEREPEAAMPPEVEAQVGQLQGGGQPLPDKARTFFESRFGQDFGQVRIHQDGVAAEATAALEARAFTLGNHIAFGQGEFDPDSEGGRHLLAHELTHVVQQGSAKTAPDVQRAQMSDDEAGRYEDLKGQADSAAGSLRGRASAAGSALRGQATAAGDGVSRTGESHAGTLRASGAASWTEVQGRGASSRDMLQASQQASWASVQGTAAARRGEVETEAGSSERSVSSAAEARGAEVEGRAAASRQEVQGDKEARGREVAGRADSSWREVRGEAETEEAGIERTQSESSETLQGQASDAITFLQGGVNGAIATARDGWTTVQGQASTLVGNVRSQVDGFVTQITQAVSARLAELTALWNTLRARASSLVSALPNLVTQTLTNIEEQLSTRLVNLSLDEAGGAWGAIEGEATGTWTAFTTKTDNELTSIESLWATLESVGAMLLPTLSEQAQGWLGGIGTSIRDGVSSLQGAWTGLQTRTGSALAGLQEQASGAWTGLQTLGGSLVSNLSGMGSAAWNKVKGLGEAAASGLWSFGSSAWNGLKGLGETLGGGLWSFGSSAWESIKSGGETAVADLWSHGTAAWNGVRSMGETATAELWNAGTAAWTGLQTFGSNAVTGLYETGTSLWNGLWSQGNSEVGGVRSGGDAEVGGLQGQANAEESALRGAGGGLGRWLSSLLSIVRSAGRSAVSSLKGQATGAWTGLQRRVTGAVSGLQGQATSIWQQLQGNVTGAWQGLQGQATSLWEGLKGGVAAAWQGVQTRTTSLWERLKGHVMGAWQGLRGRATGAWESFQGMAQGAWQGLQGQATGLWEGLTGRVQGAWQQLQGFAGSAVSTLQGVAGQAWTSVQGGWNRFSDWAGGVWGGIREGWTGLQSQVNGNVATLQGQANQTWTELQASAAQSWASIRQAWAEMKEGLTTLWAELKLHWEELRALGQSVWQTIASGVDLKAIAGEIIEGGFYGDFLEEPSFWNIVGQILVGFIPIVGQIADIRDLIAALKRVWEGTGSWVDVLLALIAFIPLAGDIIKNVKHLPKVMDMAKQLDTVKGWLRSLWGQLQQVKPLLEAAWDLFLQVGAGLWAVIADFLRRVRGGIDDYLASLNRVTTLLSSPRAKAALESNPRALEILLTDLHAAAMVETYGDRFVEFVARWEEDAVRMIATYDDAAFRVLDKFEERGMAFLRQWESGALHRTIEAAATESGIPLPYLQKVLQADGLEELIIAFRPSNKAYLDEALRRVTYPKTKVDARLNGQSFEVSSLAHPQFRTNDNGLVQATINGVDYGVVRNSEDDWVLEEMALIWDSAEERVKIEGLGGRLPMGPDVDLYFILGEDLDNIAEFDEIDGLVRQSLVLAFEQMGLDGKIVSAISHGPHIPYMSEAFLKELKDQNLDWETATPAQVQAAVANAVKDNGLVLLDNEFYWVQGADIPILYEFLGHRFPYPP